MENKTIEMLYGMEFCGKANDQRVFWHPLMGHVWMMPPKGTLWSSGQPDEAFVQKENAVNYAHRILL